MPVSSSGGKYKYPEIAVLTRGKGGKLESQTGIVLELNEEEVTELIGWTEEPEGKDWGSDYLLKDENGKKVRLANNAKNRPFRLSLAEKYASEHERGKWEVNGETLVFNRLGNAQSAQHRLVGFKLACQRNPKKGLIFRCIVVVGVSETDKVADTSDLGQKRTLGDVIFRNRDFGRISEKEQKVKAGVLAGALRLVWLRCGGKTVSSAPHFPHSEALAFQSKHPKLVEAVDLIVKLDTTKDEKQRISQYLTLPYAAGLFYLQATLRTKEDDKEPNLNGWSKAEKFWKDFASGVSRGSGDLMHSLRTRLSGLSQSGSEGRDEVCGTVIKAYLQWLEDAEAEVTTRQLTLKRKKNDKGKVVLGEEPRLGGLDITLEVVPEPQEAPEPEPEPEVEAAAESSGNAA